MAVPVKLVADIAQKATVPLVVAITALGGFVLGGLVRQPEINDLKNQVKQLKKQQEHLVQVVNAQNDEIRDLLNRYHALKVYQVFQRSDMKAQLRNSLVFQYATADYLRLMVSCIESETKPSDAETAFYCAFTKMLSGRGLSDAEMAAVKDYVVPRHKEEIGALVPCDTDSALEALLRFEEPEKGGFEFPDIDFPKVGFLDVGLPKIEFPEFGIPQFGRKREDGSR